jgi:hypothetical protein
MLIHLKKYFTNLSLPVHLCNHWPALSPVQLSLIQRVSYPDCSTPSCPLHSHKSGLLRMYVCSCLPPARALLWLPTASRQRTNWSEYTVVLMDRSRCHFSIYLTFSTPFQVPELVTVASPSQQLPSPCCLLVLPVSFSSHFAL